MKTPPRRECDDRVRAVNIVETTRQSRTNAFAARLTRTRRVSAETRERDRASRWTRTGSETTARAIPAKRQPDTDQRPVELESTPNPGSRGTAVWASYSRPPPPVVAAEITNKRKSEGHRAQPPHTGRTAPNLDSQVWVSATSRAHVKNAASKPT